MSEIKLFQICYEGDLTANFSNAILRLGAEPNFDQSWHVFLSSDRHAAPLVRWLRSAAPPDARLLVACSQFTTARDFLLIRHSLTPDADYTELHNGIARLGTVVDMPFESTFVVRSDDRTEVGMLGRALSELCPDDSLMVLGVSHDWAYSNSGLSRMHVAADEGEEMQFRTF
jgi:hypothetical protein